MKPFWVRFCVIAGVVGVAVGLIFVLPDDVVTVEETTIHVAKANLWDELGREPYERLMILYKDGTLYSMTQREPHKVAIPIDYLERVEGKATSDIIVIIHNHLGIGRASLADIALYHTLRNRGFAGFFLIKLGTGTILEYPGVQDD